MGAPFLLCDTAGMTNERWLECRMHGPKGDIPYTIGGSDVAAIFGVSPWTTPLELWMIKKGRMKPPKKSNADQLQMGHLLEPIAAYWYAQKSGPCLRGHRPLSARGSPLCAGQFRPTIRASIRWRAWHPRVQCDVFLTEKVGH